MPGVLWLALLTVFVVLVVWGIALAGEGGGRRG